jgi:hypothetical protein
MHADPSWIPRARTLNAGAYVGTRSAEIAMPAPSIVTAPQARQNDATTFGSVTHACSAQVEHSWRSSSLNQARRSTFVGTSTKPNAAHGGARWAIGRSAYLRDGPIYRMSGRMPCGGFVGP